MTSIRDIREDDRTFYMKRVRYMILYMIAVAIPVRIALDSLAGRFPALHPFIVPTVLVLVVALWFFGLKFAFAKRW